ncbi:hypothetical protein VTO73DRAFT_6438 [Trametes versicolor]
MAPPLLTIPSVDESVNFGIRRSPSELFGPTTSVNALARSTLKPALAWLMHLPGCSMASLASRWPRMQAGWLGTHMHVTEFGSSHDCAACGVVSRSLIAPVEMRTTPRHGAPTVWLKTIPDLLVDVQTPERSTPLCDSDANSQVQWMFPCKECGASTNVHAPASQARESTPAHALEGMHHFSPA